MWSLLTDRVAQNTFPAVRRASADLSVIIFRPSPSPKGGRARERLEVNLLHVELGSIVPEMEDDGLGKLVIRDILGAGSKRIKPTRSIPWYTTSFMRRYILFRNPAWKKSKNLGFLFSKPRWVRTFSSAALGRGVYAIDVG